MPDKNKELLELRTSLRTKQARYDLIQEKRNEVLKGLRKTFKLKNIAEAKKRLDAIVKEKAKLEGQLAKKIEEIQADLGA